MGYAELCFNKSDLSKDEKQKYSKIIYENSLRANNLITDLFELSKMESSEYVLNKTRIDICEYLREEIGSFIPTFDKFEFAYDFNIPEREIFLEIDTKQIDRVFQNLVANTVQYNPKGTKVMISLFELDKEVVIIFKDDGIGIPKEVAESEPGPRASSVVTRMTLPPSPPRVVVQPGGVSHVSGAAAAATRRPEDATINNARARRKNLSRRKGE
jgi:light-regulated signal transduction histidine kinase (bacteriophytochrome)